MLAVDDSSTATRALTDKAFTGTPHIRSVRQIELLSSSSRPFVSGNQSKMRMSARMGKIVESDTASPQPIDPGSPFTENQSRSDFLFACNVQDAVANFIDVGRVAYALQQGRSHRHPGHPLEQP